MRPQESYFDSEVVMLLQVLEHIDESIALLVHDAVVAQESKFHHTKHVETQRSSTRRAGLAPVKGITLIVCTYCLRLP
jgi:hypothetical protein